ncbi:dynein regulatory complex protein 9 [Lycodopsis pacificus]
MPLSRIQSLGLAAVLEDCSVQLDILGLRLAVQTDREQCPAVAQEKARLTKLRRECQYVSQQVFKLHSELEEKQSISSLLQVVEEEEQKKKAEDMRRFITPKLPHAVPPLKPSVRLFQELKQQLQQWRQRTTQMQQEKEQQLNSVCCKRTVNLDRLMEMRRKFKEMELVVMEDKEEQKKLRRQQAEARAATKLQAWWRGCMVRQGLGSFKKADDKKGKKKKKKKTTKGGKKNKK